MENNSNSLIIDVPSNIPSYNVAPIPPKNVIYVSKNSFFTSFIIIILIIVLIYSVLKYINNEKNEIPSYIETIAKKIYYDIRGIFGKTKMYTSPSVSQPVANTEPTQDLSIPINNRKFNFDNAGNSMIQKRGKTSYCYIGSDRGFRSCIEMGAEEKCQSGQIFNSEGACTNSK
jgi:hypothetical protein